MEVENDVNEKDDINDRIHNHESNVSGTGITGAVHRQVEGYHYNRVESQA